MAKTALKNKAKRKPKFKVRAYTPVSYTHLRAHET